MLKIGKLYYCIQFIHGESIKIPCIIMDFSYLEDLDKYQIDFVFFNKEKGIFDNRSTAMKYFHSYFEKIDAIDYE